MNNIEDFLKLSYTASLSYYDGDLLSLYHNKETNEFYLLLWCDVDDGVFTYVIVKVSEPRLYLFLKGKETLYKILTQSDDGFIHYIDNNKTGQWENMIKVDSKDIRVDYLPDETYIYDEEPKYVSSILCKLK